MIPIIYCERFVMSFDDSDLLLCFSVESVFYGLYLIYPPAAFIGVGLAFGYLSFLMAPKEG